MSKPKRTTFILPASRPTSSINVTPLVDVVLVLLIIFMVVSPLLDREITVSIPKTEQVDDPQEVPAEQILVRLDGAGQLTINARKVSLADYEVQLRQAMQVRVESAQIIFLIAEDDASYGKMVEAVDVAKAAGVKVIATSPTVPELPSPEP